MPLSLWQIGRALLHSDNFDRFVDPFLIAKDRRSCHLAAALPCRRIQAGITSNSR